MGYYFDKEALKRFAISKEELKKLSDEFHSEALPLADSLFNLTYWITLNKRVAKKITKGIYYKAIYFCEKTKADSDWNTWLHRILMKDLYEYFEKKKDKPQIKFDEIDKIAVNIPFVEKALNDNNFFSKNDGKLLITFLKLLPSLYLIPIMMKEIHGFNYEPIAEYVDVPDGVISSRLFRGRKLLFFHLLERSITDDEKKILHSTGYAPLSIFELRKTSDLLDKEIKDDLEKESLLVKLEKDKNLKLEYQIQEKVKSILQKVPHKKKVPQILMSRIKRRAKKEFSERGSKILIENASIEKT